MEYIKICVNRKILSIGKSLKKRPVVYSREVTLVSFFSNTLWACK